MKLKKRNNNLLIKLKKANKMMKKLNQNTNNYQLYRSKNVIAIEVKLRKCDINQHHQDFLNKISIPNHLLEEHIKEINKRNNNNKNIQMV